MPNYISKVELPDGSPFELKMPHSLNIDNHTYDGTNSLSVGSTIDFIISTNISSTNSLTGTYLGNGLLFNGKVIIYRVGYDIPNSNSPITLTLSTPNIPNLDAYMCSVYMSANMPCKNTYPAGTMLMLVYYNGKFYIVNPFSFVA